MNEFDPYPAQWSRNMAEAGVIAPCVVDERSILDVCAADLVDYSQCHFFGGISVWPAALRIAGVPDDFPVWSGSCPCQGFSVAGQGRGFLDERHLWPAWFHLIEQRRPPIIFGEQVASPLAGAWLDLVCADLEGIGYAVGTAVAPAAGFGAPHGRHRTWFVAHALRPGWSERWTFARRGQTARSGVAGELADDDDDERLERRLGRSERRNKRAVGAGGVGDVGALDEPQSPRRRRGLTMEDWRRDEFGGPGAERHVSGVEHSDVAGRGTGRSRSWEQSLRDERGGGAVTLVDAESEQARVSRFARERRATRGFWADADWISCRGGKWRPIEPGTFPLAHGAVNRMGKLRAYGNAIVLPQAVEFIKAALAALMEVTP